MQAYDVYRDISDRTGGDIYIGVVGPVRTGKSTFISKLMNLLVLPNLADDHAKERMIDELPQSGQGRSIMTTQPRFVPDQAVRVTVDDKATFNIRMVDCVGYLVDGAVGHLEDEKPRMVRTPWFEYDIPFEQAAEVGTRKVIAEHSTVGVVMTTDGTIADIPRESYVPAEERVVSELKALGKPFVIVLNSAQPDTDAARALCEQLKEKYQSAVLLMDVMRFDKQDMTALLTDLLYEFPIRRINVNISKWVCALSPDHWLLADVMERVRAGTDDMHLMRDYARIADVFAQADYASRVHIDDITLGDGSINMGVAVDEALFYQVLGEECGCEIKDDRHLVSIVKELVNAKTEYDRLEGALNSVRLTGYGVVQPVMEEISLEQPELIQQGNKFGVCLKASAPSLHLIQVDVQTEVSPIIGTEQQSEDFINFLMEEYKTDPARIWETDIFGKSLHEIVKEGLAGKNANIPEDARDKLQETLQRVVNEGDGGMLCILL